MSVPSADELLSHVREAASQAVCYVEGMAKEDFFADKRTQQAVILNIVILGEAATKLMDNHPATVVLMPGIEWRSMRGMRTALRTATTTSISTQCGRLSRQSCRNWWRRLAILG